MDFLPSDHKVLLRKASAGAAGGGWHFGVDDRAQHPVVPEPHKALKLCLPQSRLFSWRRGARLRPSPLTVPGQRKGQMVKAEQAAPCPPAERKIPLTRYWPLRPAFLPKLATIPAWGRWQCLTGCGGLRLGCPHRKGKLVLDKARTRSVKALNGRCCR